MVTVPEEVDSVDSFVEVDSLSAETPILYAGAEAESDS